MPCEAKRTAIQEAQLPQSSMNRSIDPFLVRTPLLGYCPFTQVPLSLVASCSNMDTSIGLDMGWILLLTQQRCVN